MNRQERALGIWSKLFGEWEAPDGGQLLDQVRDAIREPGDTTDRLAALLAQGPDLNQPPERPVFSIMVTLGIMFSDYSRFPLILAALLHKPERLLLLLTGERKWKSSFC